MNPLHNSHNCHDGEEFREYIRGLLDLIGLAEQYKDLLTDDTSMELYRQAFTHNSIDSLMNYEWLEILGDGSMNKMIVWYVSRRFPILQNPDGVKVIARLKINMVSKKKFAEIAEGLGMMRFIRYDSEQIQSSNLVALRSLMEDVLEAFFGATEWLLDEKVEPGSGYGICYLLLQHILDSTEISLEFNDLFDPITRLKETMDVHRNQFPGNIKYRQMKDPNYIPPVFNPDQSKTSRMMHMHLHPPPLQKVQCVYQGPGAHGELILGRGEGPSMDDAKHVAAQDAIFFLEQRNIKKNIPPYYLRIREWLQTKTDPRR